MENTNCFFSEVKVGEPCPNFEAQAVMADNEFKNVSLEENMKAGKWTILFFWPLDFTAVCPTEIIELNKIYSELQKENTEVFGISTDSVYSHKAWKELDPKDGGIGHIQFPMLEDKTLAISEMFGVLKDDMGAALRGLFIISPEGILEHATINNLNVGRSTDELMRTLSALKSGGLCPVNWKKGDAGL